MSRKTGIKMTAPTMDAHSPVTIYVQPMPFDDWSHAVARQLNALPVFRGKAETIEFIPMSRVQATKFSENSLPGPFEVRFLNVDLGSAIRTVAANRDIDVLVPEGLRGWVDGTFSDELGPKDAHRLLEDVLKAAGSKARVSVDRNGLFRIVGSEDRQDVEDTPSSR